ncbi:NAD/FAD-binding protein [Limnohabitans sp. MMS-10A-160]|uniref:NAD(P)/FAD-dependent oxidoreductase n=1 Tax=unclassified Limnohabitans TaxID=2626134 RepID=UPI000D37BFA3|nr:MULTISPECIES: FAD-dependent oxidoreductase [unclassified Limnohabitans]PUE20573.1 NAD/FAD-binding protein [Limnohabitans sp. MMS-10A-192]PUE25039.1 NAD/FAD-binding protein [Limnohabitans sp. MMS-10A-160]
MKLAIVGSGISGLAVAHTLRGVADITLFEAGDYFGGHTHTVDVTLPTAKGVVTHGVDTGFLVFNERTYPNLIQLFSDLQVETAPSDMSFSVKVPGAKNGRALEWSGTNLNTVFAQRGNLVSPRFWRMLSDVIRFNELCTRIAQEQSEQALQQPLKDFLTTHKFSEQFRDWYFLPMLGCIWSCPTDQMLQFPVATMIRFCHNHGLIQVMNRPQWFSVVGGARQYVDKILAHVPDKRLNTPVRMVERDEQGVRIITDGRTEHFDEVVIATHTDQALAMLREATPNEQHVLGSIRYQANRAVLHTDASMLPANPKTWAAWNYERAPSNERESSRVCLHYLLNRLQRIPFEQPVVVSLNPVQGIDPSTIVGEYDYAHPVFDLRAIKAQQCLPLIQGLQHTWFAGAWAGYGFHEDGLKSGLQVGRMLLSKMKATTP